MKQLKKTNSKPNRIQLLCDEISMNLPMLSIIFPILSTRVTYAWTENKCIYWWTERHKKKHDIDKNKVLTAKA
jgi:hypothetical protein